MTEKVDRLRVSSIAGVEYSSRAQEFEPIFGGVKFTLSRYVTYVIIYVFMVVMGSDFLLFSH